MKKKINIFIDLYAGTLECTAMQILPFDWVFWAYSPQSHTYVLCQFHTALVKIGLVLARLFHFNSLLVCYTKLTDRFSSRLGGLVALWRPRPSGTRQYVS